MSKEEKDEEKIPLTRPPSFTHPNRIKDSSNHQFESHPLLSLCNMYPNTMPISRNERMWTKKFSKPCSGVARE